VDALLIRKFLENSNILAEKLIGVEATSGTEKILKIKH
jgi:hypothetical protein